MSMESVVYMMDCIEGMQMYPDKHFDLAIVDPPYGIGVGEMSYLKKGVHTVRQKNGGRLDANRNKTSYSKKGWDSKTPTQEYYDELVRVSKNQIIFGIEYMGWEGVGSGRIKWDKGIPEGVSFGRYETAYCSIIDNEVILPLLWAGMCQAKSLSEPMTQQGDKKLNEKRIHPCHKPILLYKKLLMDYGFKGMSILDTHVGGGSSRIAADSAGCYFTGFEIDKEYFDAQEKRFRDFKLQLKMF